MLYGYIRVSTDKQTVENQRYEILKYCQCHQLHIDGWIEEQVSGTVTYRKRRLGTLLKHVKSGDIIICAELSRLGRNMLMIMEILSLCMSKNCAVWTIKDNYRLGDDLQSKVLAFAFSLSAEIERNLISQRTREALARKKAEGAVLGRPRQKSPQTSLKLYKKHGYIVSRLKEKVSIAQIARECKVNYKTMLRYVHSYIDPTPDPTPETPS